MVAAQPVTSLKTWGKAVPSTSRGAGAPGVRRAGPAWAGPRRVLLDGRHAPGRSGRDASKKSVSGERRGGSVSPRRRGAAALPGGLPLTPKAQPSGNKRREAPEENSGSAV